ncbi:MAG TPA: hypothetical protein DDW52_27920 [Planctomycetaceae bacterium]|nr:hypothetical protein [Planctomycetaceae bacterium]
MTTTILWISVRRLLNSPQELVLIVVVPILFFSIFAMIFSRGVGGGTAPLSIAVVDQDNSDLSKRIVATLKNQSDFEAVRGGGRVPDGWTLQRLAKDLLARTETDLVVMIPEGFTQNILSVAPEQSPQQADKIASIAILDKGTNQIHAQVVKALLGEAVANSVATHQATQLAGEFQPATTPSGSAVVTASHGVRSTGHNALQQVDQTAGPEQLAAAFAKYAAPSAGSAVSNQLGFENQNVFGFDRHNPKIAMYAAGIAVMFLLFSATGAGGSLLEEREAGTLSRLLASELSIGQLLAGKWLYICLLGLCQLIIMFSWAQLVFGVDLLGRPLRFLAIGVPTCCSAASLAMLLAVICKSRAQLNGVSVVVVLSMSALGGSMIPRYIMSESMQRMGKLTFNGWALDGFEKVFWFDLPLSALTTEIAILASLAFVLGLAARLLATRWSVSP